MVNSKVIKWAEGHPTRVRLIVVAWLLLSPILITFAAFLFLKEEMWPEVKDAFADSVSALKSGSLPE